MFALLKLLFLPVVIVHLTYSDTVDDYISKILKFNTVLKSYKMDNRNLTEQIKQMDGRISEKIRKHDYFMRIASKMVHQETRLFKELKNDLSLKYAEEADLLDQVSKWQQNYTFLEQDLASLKNAVVLMEKRKKQGKDKNCKKQLITTMSTTQLQPRSINKKRLDELNKRNIEIYLQTLKQVLAKVQFNKALKKMLSTQLERKKEYLKTIGKDIENTLTESFSNITRSQNIIDLLKSKSEKMTEAIDLLKLKLTALREAMIETDEEVDSILLVMKQFIADSTCYGKLERQVIGFRAMSTDFTDMVDTVRRISRRHRVHT